MGNQPSRRGTNVLSAALAEYVRAELSRRGMTQTQLANRTDYDVKSISNALGHRATVSTHVWSDILGALDIEVGFRVDNEGSRITVYRM